MAAGSGGPHGARLGRDRALLIYIGVGALILLPGLITSFGLWTETATPAGAALAAFHDAMLKIAFGHGPRFWMGVAGSTMMVLLLLYPLRKLFGLGGWMSVGSWFHFHVVFGLLGPILILYHSYFGSGSTPANVALVTTLVVAASGLFGHYVYTRLSADHHEARRGAREALEAIIAELSRLPATPTRTRLVDDLRAYEARMTELRRHVLVRLGISGRLRALRRDLWQRAGWLIDNLGPEAGWSPLDCGETKGRIKLAMGQFFAGLGCSVRRSSYERIAGIWRLLHMPLFFITVVAATIHIYKVWDIEGMSGAAVQEASLDAAEPSGKDEPPGPGPGAAARDVAGALALREASAPERRGEEGGASKSVATSESPVAIGAAGKLIAPRKVVSQTIDVAKLPSPKPVSPEPDPIAEMLEKPTLVEGPRLARRPNARIIAAELERPAAVVPVRPTQPLSESQPAKPSTPAPAPTRLAASPEPPPSPPVAKAQPQPQPPAPPLPPRKKVAKAEPPKVVAPKAVPAKVVPAKVVPPKVGPPLAETSDPVAQLGKVVNKWDNTGKLDPRTVRERLDVLKKDRSFDHSETRFPLTGRHRRVACESCHKSTLKDTPRRCISCHRKDDVHRGRRPNCEKCHVTTNWGTIRRR